MGKLDHALERGFAQLDALTPKQDDGVVLRRGSDVPPKATRYLWKGYIPKGMAVILGGEPGSAKTTMAIDHGATVTNGGRWPDGSRCEHTGNVVIYSSEDSPDVTLVPRLIAAGANMERVYFVDSIKENGKKLPFDPSRDIHELHKAADRIGGVSLLIIDPIVNVVSGDMNKANDVRRSMQPLVDFAEVHDCAVIGISHVSKNSKDKSPLDRVIGSQAFGALARMVHLVGKNPETGERVMTRAKSNISEEGGGFSYGVEIVTIDGGIETTRIRWGEYLEGSARDILGSVEKQDADNESQEDLERLIVDLLTDNGGKMQAKLIQNEIRDAGYSMTTANRTKNRLGIKSEKEKGTVKGAWTWLLPQGQTKRNREESEESGQIYAVSSVSLVDSSQAEVEL